MFGEALSALEKYLLAHGGPEIMAAIRAKKYEQGAGLAAKLGVEGGADLARAYPKSAAVLGGLGAGYAMWHQGQEQTEPNDDARLKQVYGYGL